jgi:tRNA uridine 5-carboxymethylaminomethyl modification enzyme
MAAGMGLSVSGPVLAADLLKRPGVAIESLLGLVPGLGELPAGAALTLETEIKYEGYLARQAAEMRQAAAREGLAIPPDLAWREVSGLTGEAVEILGRLSPSTIGQAGRLRGITPAAVAAILIHLRKLGRG